MDYKNIAASIIENIGGENNIRSIMSCFTRVRIEVKDKALVKEENIRKIDGVKGINWLRDTIQIIVGGACNDIYDELSQLVHIKGDTDKVTKSEKIVEKKMNVLEMILDYAGNVMIPVVTIIFVSGMIQSILAMLAYLQVDTTAFAYQSFYCIGQAGFYFLPIFLGFSAANKLKMNPYVGALIGAVLVYPTLIELGSAGGYASFIGIPVKLTTYTSTIFPILISMPIVKLINNFAKKISFKSLSTILIPGITVILAIPVVLILTGPISAWVSDALVAVFEFLFNKLSIVGGFIIGALSPYTVLTGAHVGYAVAITISELTAKGYSLFYAMASYGNAAMAGAAFGVYLKTKNKNTKQQALSASMIATIGISEPSLFGVLLPKKKPLISIGLAQGICAAISLALGVKAYGFVLCGLGGIPGFLGETFVAWIILFVAAFVIAAIITYVLGFKDDPVEEQ